MSTIQSRAGGIAGSTLGARIGIFTFSLMAYAIGMTALAWLVACVAGLVPFGTGPFRVEHAGAALAVDSALTLLFGAQHSVMARRAFKRVWMRVVPPAAERSTFVLAAGLTLGLVLWLWQPMGTVIWSVSGAAAAYGLWTLFALGWLYLVAATFVTNHFDLFGLRQAWLHLHGRPYRPVPFVRRWMYRYSRHPMMAGILVGLWATPQMHADHLALAVAMSGYIALGVMFEEHELALHFGQKYREYRRQVGALLPRLTR